MKRYTVYWSNGRRDGDMAFDLLSDAENKFASECARRDIERVEIIDNIDPDEPVTIQEWQAEDIGVALLRAENKISREEAEGRIARAEAKREGRP